MSRVPYQLLELNIISAQDLALVSKNPRTYAVAWVDPTRKLRTRIDDLGKASPTWNDKFVFRIDDAFLNSDESIVTVEIYVVGWLRDTPVGSVTVSIGNLIPLSVRRERSSRRFVALQIRRPSSRPQGILNMGVSLLDNTMRSMPLCSELSASAVGFRDLMDEKMGKKKKKLNEDVDGIDCKEKKIRLFRSMSDQTDRTRKQGGANQRKGGSVCNGSVVYYGGGGGGSVVNGGGSAVNGGGSMVDGGGSVVNSDVGPSPSVVAAAVAWGLYPTQHGPAPKPGSSVLEDWTVEETSMEGLKSKIERWRMELPQKYDQKYQRLENNKRREKKKNHRRSKTAVDDGGGGGGDDEDGLFTCFGNAYGCEFTIVCGAKKDKGGGGRKERRRTKGHTSSKTSVSEIYS
ncbi:hypothetical protein ACP275_06G204800 [Erythranthe tilingii]